jgi:hypothetical protein
MARGYVGVTLCTSEKYDVNKDSLISGRRAGSALDDEGSEALVEGERGDFDAIDAGIGGAALAGDDELLDEVAFALDVHLEGAVGEEAAGAEQAEGVGDIAEPEANADSLNLTADDDLAMFEDIEGVGRALHTGMIGRVRRAVEPPR